MPRSTSRGTKVELHEAACRLVERCLREGVPALGDSPSWEAFERFILGELLRDFPGFSTREYRTAMNTRLALELRRRSRTRQVTLRFRRA